ncbi:hypothetical protein ACCC88_03620 [Sphingomonas sp. Sphisp140]
MRTEETKLVELGSVSADTRGSVMGIADNEFGWMRPLGLHDD